jgi:hypothetical protein
MTFSRFSHAGVSPSTKPPASIPAVREAELVDERLHFVGKSSDALRIREAHLD